MRMKDFGKSMADRIQDLKSDFDSIMEDIDANGRRLKSQVDELREVIEKKEKTIEALTSLAIGQSKENAEFWCNMAKNKRSPLAGGEPCPFCGANVYLNADGNIVHPHSFNCWLSSVAAKPEDWNRRASHV